LYLARASSINVTQSATRVADLADMDTGGLKTRRVSAASRLAGAKNPDEQHNGNRARGLLLVLV